MKATLLWVSTHRHSLYIDYVELHKCLIHPKLLVIGLRKYANLFSKKSTNLSQTI